MKIVGETKFKSLVLHIPDATTLHQLFKEFISNINTYYMGKPIYDVELSEEALKDFKFDVKKCDRLYCFYCTYVNKKQKCIFQGRMEYNGKLLYFELCVHHGPNEPTHAQIFICANVNLFIQSVLSEGISDEFFEQLRQSLVIDGIEIDENIKEFLDFCYYNDNIFYEISEEMDEDVEQTFNENVKHFTPSLKHKKKEFFRFFEIRRHYNDFLGYCFRNGRVLNEEKNVFCQINV